MRKMQFLVFVMCVFFVSCDSTPIDNSAAAPSPTPKASPSPAKPPLSAEAAVAEKEYQFTLDSEERARVRREAGDWAIRQNPGWQVKGIACDSPPTGNVFFIDVDISRNKDSQVVRLFMQAMFTPDGTYYWNASPVSLSQRIANIQATPGP